MPVCRCPAYPEVTEIAREGLPLSGPSLQQLSSSSHEQVRKKVTSLTHPNSPQGRSQWSHSSQPLAWRLLTCDLSGQPMVTELARSSPARWMTRPPRTTTDGRG